MGFLGLREYTYKMSLNIARSLFRMAQPVYTPISMQKGYHLSTSIISVIKYSNFANQMV